MSTWAQRSVQASGQLWPAVRTALLVVAIGAVIYLNARIVVAIQDGAFRELVRGAAPFGFVLAGLVYLTGHALRILRLALLIGGWRVGFRDIASFHLMTATVSLTAPLKLGEVYRVVEMTSLAGGFVRALAIAWCERTLDMLVLLALLVLAIGQTTGEASGFGGVTVLAASFVTVTAIAFFILPDNLRRLAVLIIRRYDDPRTISVLRMVDQLRHAILEAPNLVRRKVASLATLTAFIWMCEMACFAIAVPSIEGSLEAALDALLTFLSALTKGETLLSVISSGGATKFGVPALSYLAATQVPLAALGLLATLRYVRRRSHV
jgi:hypothetical protein